MTKEEKRKAYQKAYQLANKEKLRAKAKAYYEANKDEIKARIKSYVLNNAEVVKKNKREYHHKNKDRLNAVSREAHHKNKKKRNAISRDYYYKNKDEITIKGKLYRQKNKKKRNEYERSRKEADSVYKLKCSIRSRLSKSFSRGGFKKDIKTESMIGCTFEFMHNYIVSQFVDGMTLDNYGEWHIDHIIPLSSANNEKELIALAHYTNLQPLWAEDNMIKGCKIL